jgi:hypothetical protein
MTITETVRAAICAYPTGHLGWTREWEEVRRSSFAPSTNISHCTFPDMLSLQAAARSRCCHPLGPHSAAGPCLFRRCLLLSRSFLPPCASVTRPFCLRIPVFLMQCHATRGPAPGSCRLSAEHAHLHTLRTHSIPVLAHELAHGAPHVQRGSLL